MKYPFKERDNFKFGSAGRIKIAPSFAMHLREQ